MTQAPQHAAPAPSNSAPANPAPAIPAPGGAGGLGVANPAPLGLAAFALTTFVLSFVNAGLFDGEPVVFGLALAYGGIAQFAAGMWEFTKGNVFGATAFTSFGAFWVSFWWLTGHTPELGELTPAQASHGIGLYLLAWGIFTAYMTVAALRESKAVLAVFVLLTITFLLLAIGNLGQTEGIVKAGGYVGILTALAAWYASFAGVVAATFGRDVVPVGPPR